MQSADKGSARNTEHRTENRTGKIQQQQRNAAQRNATDEEPTRDLDLALALASALALAMAMALARWR